MKLKELFTSANIELPKIKDREIKGITSDSKQIKKGYIFVALNGTKTNGNIYINEAIKKGASLIISEEEIKSNKTIKVDNARDVLSRLVDAYYDNPSSKMKFIGVSGTNGKSSTTYLLKQIFDEANIKTGLLGTVKNLSIEKEIVFEDEKTSNMTTKDPEILYKVLNQMVIDGVGTVIMETSSHSLKNDKLSPIGFEIGVFTNLSEDHLDFHKTMKDYFESKCKLYQNSKKVIVNIDDEYGQKIYSIYKDRAKSCSTKNKSADYYANNIRKTKNGYSFLINGEKVKCNSPCKFMVMNVILAYATACEYKIDKSVILKKIEYSNLLEGRVETVIDKDIKVIIDYAHTPDALLKLLQSFKKDKIILVFGCGGDREKEKRKIMGQIAEENAGQVILTSDNSRSENPIDIINEIKKGAPNAEITVDRKEAIEKAILSANKNKIVILAGKGHEKYEIINNQKKQFDEKQIAINAYKRRIKK